MLKIKELEDKSRNRRGRFSKRGNFIMEDFRNPSYNVPNLEGFKVFFDQLKPYVSYRSAPVSEDTKKKVQELNNWMAKEISLLSNLHSTGRQLFLQINN